METALKDRLALKLEERDPGEFHFSDIYGPDWQGLYIGDRVKLGHEFLRLVRENTFSGILDTGKKKNGGRIYLKEG